ncbi:MAG: EamA family transporter, partial [Actinomycetes bacterium]
ERLRRSQWIGVMLGVSGVVVVVIDKVRDGVGDVTTPALCAMVISIIGMSTGTLVQRARGREMPLVTGTAAQYVSAGAVLLVASSLFEDWEFTINIELVLALMWSVFILSIAAVMLMMLLISRHSAARVSSLFFLTPALSAIESAILFGERLSPLALVALVVALTGVWLTMRNPVVAPSPESLLADQS